MAIIDNIKKFEIEPRQKMKNISGEEIPNSVVLSKSSYAEYDHDNNDYTIFVESALRCETRSTVLSAEAFEIFSSFKPE